jgi:CRISPR-associated protein Csm3
MENATFHPLHTKIIIGGVMECKTGIHIGAAPETFEIGGIDSPVVRDPITEEPYIPGSSLKGKLRSLMERALNKRLSGDKTKMHCCADRKCEVCRLFGSVPIVEPKEEKIPSPLYVRDLCLDPESKAKLEKISSPLKYTEWKKENALDRITAASNPRDIERVPKEAEFNMELVYNVSDDNVELVPEDMNNLVSALCLLEDDFLGGHGSRGYGKVAFTINKFIARKVGYYQAENEEDRKQNEYKMEKPEKKPGMNLTEFKKKLPVAIQEMKEKGFLPGNG